MPRTQNNSDSQDSERNGEENRRPHRIGKPWRNDTLDKNTRIAWIATRTMAMHSTVKILPQQPQIRISLLDPMLYIESRFPPEQFLMRYMPYYKQYMGGCFQPFVKEGEGYIFAHKDQKILMNEFVRYDWSDVVIMDLNKCQVSTEDWRVLSENGPQFKKLKVLILKKNQIEYLKPKQIESFPGLKALNLGKKLQDENPLNQESITQLIEFTALNKIPIIFFNRER